MIIKNVGRKPVNVRGTRVEPGASVEIALTEEEFKAASLSVAIEKETGSEAKALGKGRFKKLTEPVKDKITEEVD